MAEKASCRVRTPDVVERSFIFPIGFEGLLVIMRPDVKTYPTLEDGKFGSFCPPLSSAYGSIYSVLLLDRNLHVLAIKSAR